MNISLILYYALRLFRIVEVCCDKNQKIAARNFSRLFIKMQSPPITMLIISSILIGVNPDNSKLAVWFWLFGSLGYIFGFLYIPLVHFDRLKEQGYDPRDFSVPISISMFIHRIGEFVTLMLGETILSLVLVVEGYKGDIDETINIATFCACSFTVTLLHYHHFTSYPDNAEGHIARKSKSKGAKFIVLCIYGYSSALMAMGVGSKYILKHTIYDSKSNVVNFSYCMSLACCFVIMQWMHSYHRGGPGLYFRNLLEAVKFVVGYIRGTASTREEAIIDVITVAIFSAKVTSVAALIWLGCVRDLAPSSCAFSVFAITAFQTIVVSIESPFERAQVAEVADKSFYRKRSMSSE